MLKCQNKFSHHTPKKSSHPSQKNIYCYFRLKNDPFHLKNTYFHSSTMILCQNQNYYKKIFTTFHCSNNDPSFISSLIVLGKKIHNNSNNRYLSFL